MKEFELGLHASIPNEIDMAFLNLIKESVDVFIKDIDNCELKILVFESKEHPVFGSHNNTIYINYFYKDFIKLNTVDDIVFILFHELGHFNVKEKSTFHKKDYFFVIINSIISILIIISCLSVPINLILLPYFLINTYYFIKFRRDSIIIELYCDNYRFALTGNKDFNNRELWESISIENLTHPNSKERNLEINQISETDYYQYRNYFLNKITYFQCFKLFSLSKAQLICLLFSKNQI